jgi:glutamate/tyrosine decarboxylase-like PLP-dependent enzyme
VGCGVFFCRHRESVAKTFRSDVTYMPGKTAGQHVEAAKTFDPLTHSAQWSRRFIGLKLFMSLAEGGEAGLAGMLEHQTRMGQVLRELLTTSGWRIVNSTPLPVVCFTRDGLAPTAFLAALRERQIAWMSEAPVGGVPVVRACVTSFKTTEKDVEWVVGQMNALVSEMALGKTA